MLAETPTTTTTTTTSSPSRRSYPPGAEMVEDDISLENLQAQIDMSMSFAQNLVSSWVKPNKPGISRKKIDLENEMLEAARRRPRLGVGAAVPDAISASRDTARLKGRLVGKKRDRDEAGAIATWMGDEDEEESRAGAIKKKVKLDPFDKSKQKKAGPFIPPAPVQAAPSTSREVEARHELEADTVASKSGSETQSSNRRKKHKLLKLPAISAASGLGNEDGAVVSNDPILPTLKRISKEEKRQDVVDKLDVLSTSSDSQREPSQSSDTGLKFSAASLIRTREPPSPSKLSADLLKKPLLNLQEISDVSGSEDEADNSTPSRPKKKRRRRKKKKGANDPPTSPAPAPSSTIKLLIA